MTKLMTKGGSGKKRDYPGLNLGAIFLVTGFNVGERVMVKWVEGKIMISKYRGEKARQLKTKPDW